MKAHLFAFFLTSLSVPALAAEAPDACRYLKDVENKECAGLDEAALAALDEQAQKRKADVAKVYEALRQNAYLEGVKDDKDKSKSSIAGTEIVLNAVEPPLNERTIPAWYPNDPKVLDVYRRWIVGVNDALRMAKDDKDNPVSAERRREIDALLANNKVTLERMKGLKSADEFRCFVGDSCGSRGGVEGAPTGAVFTAQSAPATDFVVKADNRPYRLQSPQPGGSLDKGTPSPVTSVAASEEGTTSKRAIAAASALVAAGLATGAAWLKKRKEDGEWSDAQKEVAAQEPKAAPAPKAEPVAKAGPVNLNGYVPDADEQKVINDLVKNAERSSVDSLLKYINAKTNVGGYGYDAVAQAAERVGTMISNGQIVISPR